MEIKLKFLLQYNIVLSLCMQFWYDKTMFQHDTKFLHIRFTEEVFIEDVWKEQGEQYS